MVVAIVAATMLACATPARAEEGSFAKDFGLGVGAVFVNALYMPAKFVYGVLGSITGGFAYCLTGGNTSVANSIWKPSMGGTYVVTPTHLRGEAPICFSGTSDCGSSTGTAPSGDDGKKAW